MLMTPENLKLRLPLHRQVLKELTYKKKNLLLMGGSVLFALIIYFSAIKNTLDLYTRCNELVEQLLQADNASYQMIQLQKELQEIESIYGDNKETSSNHQQVLLETISNYCSGNNVILREFPKSTVFNEQDFSVESNMVVVEGSFNNLLRLIYLLEQKNKTGKIASVQFQTKNDFKTKQLALIASIYIQTIKKTAYEL